MKTVLVNAFESPIGRIQTAEIEGRLVSVCLPNELKSEIDERLFHRVGQVKVQQGGEVNSRAQDQILAYLHGELRRFDLPWTVSAPPFHCRVLDEVARIPYGQTTTYGSLATSLGKPGAARAVGMANAKNPLPLVIPCHRVVGQKGLVGYGGGLPLKRWLLAMEGALPDTGQAGLFEPERISRSGR
jgi:methylated-DNA-[protein]-cysteine S-methyltransferase